MKFRTLIILLCGTLLLSSCGYNTIQKNEEDVFAAWGDVEATYQRRADLIPNLVSTVKAYAAHEKETLTEVTNARAKVGQTKVSTDKLGDPAAMQQFQQAQGALSGALSRLLVVVERYPDLKANQNFLDLQAQLEGTENRIAVERRRFNEAVQAYNTAIRKFPGNILAGMFGFKEKPYFKAQPGSEKAPKVKF